MILAGTTPNLALAFNGSNNNQKLIQENLCVNNAFCQNKFSQASGHFSSFEQQPVTGGWPLSTPPDITPSLGKTAIAGIGFGDISSTGISDPASVIATIPVGSLPFGIAFDSANGNLYVTNGGNNTVSVIDGRTNTVIATISVGGAPQGPVFIAFDSANGNLYVSNPRGNSVSVISGNTNAVIGTGTGTDIPILNGPEGIAFDSTNDNVYVAAEGGAVSVISGQTNTVIATIPLQLPEDPSAIAFDPTNDNLYITNSAGNTVSVISGQTNTVLGSPIVVGGFPQGIAFDSTNGNLYVVISQGDTVSVISGQTVWSYEMNISSMIYVRVS